MNMIQEKKNRFEIYINTDLTDVRWLNYFVRQRGVYKYKSVFLK